MKRFTVKEPIYGYGVQVLVGDKQKAKDYIKKTFKVGEECLAGNFHARYFTLEGEKDGKNVVHQFIYIEEFDWSIGQQGLLAHEIMHFVFDVMDRVGLKLEINREGSGNEEAYTYYFQHFMCSIWDKLAMYHEKAIQKQKKKL